MAKFDSIEEHCARGEFWSCGKCGDRYNKESFGREMVVQDSKKAQKR